MEDVDCMLFLYNTFLHSSLKLSNLVHLLIILKNVFFLTQLKKHEQIPFETEIFEMMILKLKNSDFITPKVQST